MLRDGARSAPRWNGCGGTLRAAEHPGGGPGGRERGVRAEPELPGCGRQAEGSLSPLHRSRQRTAHLRGLGAGRELRALCPWQGAQLHPRFSGTPGHKLQHRGAASPCTGQALACARSSREVRAAPKTSQERVPSPPQGCAPLCQPGHMCQARAQAPVDIYPPRWQGKVAGSQAVRVSKLCRA